MFIQSKSSWMANEFNESVLWKNLAFWLTSFEQGLEKIGPKMVPISLLPIW